MEPKNFAPWAVSRSLSLRVLFSPTSLLLINYNLWQLYNFRILVRRIWARTQPEKRGRRCFWKYVDFWRKGRIDDMACMIAIFNWIFYCPFIISLQHRFFKKEKEKLKITITVSSMRLMMAFSKMEKSPSGRFKQKKLWTVVLNRMKRGRYSNWWSQFKIIWYFV